MWPAHLKAGFSRQEKLICQCIEIRQLFSLNVALNSLKGMFNSKNHLKDCKKIGKILGLQASNLAPKIG